MSKPMTPRQWKRAMKKWGVDIHYYSGWKHRGRPVSLGWGNVHGVVVHHTGSDGGDSPSYNAFLFKQGRAGIPGPLCQATCDADGDVHLGAVGRANHAGLGSSRTYGKVLNESYEGYHHQIDPGADNMDGNAVFYGIEVKYSGYHPMAARQYEQTVRFCAAICDHYGWSALSVIGHKEWSDRKWDPGNERMDKIRRDVRSLLEAGPDGKGKEPEPDHVIGGYDMASKKDREQLVDDVARGVYKAFAHITLDRGGKEKHTSLGGLFHELEQEQDRMKGMLREVLAELEKGK